MGVCAKQMNYGDVAWRCLDCEKDPTCIICSECFEKGDHTGHRVQLKRNVGGCCDCGDPEAWDENHFCSDHKGLHDVNYKEILEKMPQNVKDSAISVFNQVAQKLKYNCLKLQNYQEFFMKTNMSEDKFKNTQVACIKLLFEFMRDRIQECPTFIYIVDEALNTIFLDAKKFVKNQDHKECCVRTYPESDQDKHAEFLAQIEQYPEKEKLCTCSALDLCMQTNAILDNETREVVYLFLFSLFQSYHFKQCLTHSYAANYKYIKHKDLDPERNDISAIGVQFFTSDEMSMLIFKNELLRNNILSCFQEIFNEFSKYPQNREIYWCVQTCIHDLKYMARPECIKYCVANTDWIERIIEILGDFYFIDVKEQRTTMIVFQHEGGPNNLLIELEIQIFKVLNIYLKELDPLNIEKNQSVLNSFLKVFTRCDETFTSRSLSKHGFFNLPVHRTFTYFFTRYLFQQNDFSMQQMLTNQELKKIMLVLIKHVSFVNEIAARKWVYLGQALELYPHFYYKLCDRLVMQDLALFQMVIAIDSTDIFEYIIQNFGLDQQLNDLIQGVQKRNLDPKAFEKYEKFDSQKLKMELVNFLKFIVQICICEISFLKQLVNRKEEKQEQNHHQKDMNSEKTLKLWRHAVKKEAVHLLLLNKVNTSIGVLKESMIEVLRKDEYFEEALFEVSDQSRDLKNQLTFKLKDDLHSWFDPFQYISPSQHSLIYQMYEQNQLQNKEGINDIVGDFLGNYQFATEINPQIIEKMAGSSLIKVICPLLIIWIKFSKENEQNQDMQIMQSVFKPSFVARMHAQSQIVSNVAQMLNDGDQKLFNPLLGAMSSKVDESFAKNFVDSNVGHVCLKLLVLALKAKDKTALLQELKWDNNQLVRQLILMKNDCDVKMKQIIEFVLQKIYEIDNQQFQIIANEMGLQQKEATNEPSENKKSDKTAESKDKLKNKKNKLLAKMKNKGKKFLTENQDPNAHVLPTATEDEVIQCAFCQEQLVQNIFAENPFGNFAFVQTSKLYYNSVEQTIKNQRRALKNSDLSQQFQETEEDCSYPELKNFEESKQQSGKPLDLPKILGDFVHPFSGSGAVMTNCKHFSHVECLRKYHMQCEMNQEAQYQKRLSGFSDGEFACPICKSINNAIMPIYEIGKISQLDEKMKNLVDFVLEIISDVVQKQEGDTRSILLRDVKQNPSKLLAQMSNFITHNIFLIDLKGFSSFECEKYQRIYSSAKSIIEIALTAKHLVLDNIEVMPSQSTLEQVVLGVFEENLEKMFDSTIPLFSQNLTEICIQTMIVSSMHFDSLDYVVKNFYNLLRIQFVLAAIFRKNGGKLQEISVTELAEFPENDELLIEIELSVMRKILAAVFSIKKDQEKFKEICLSNTNQQELQMIKEYFKLDKIKSLKEQMTELQDINQEDGLGNQMFELKAILGKFASSKYLQDSLQEYIKKIGENPQMPVNLILMTPYFVFDLYEIPKNYQNLQTEYYKRKCGYCQEVVKDSATCLQCGVTMCWMNFNWRDEKQMQCRAADQLPDEGLLTWHARLHEGGCTAFLHTSTGQIILMQNGTPSIYDSPYRNKYGELVSEADKKYNEFQIDEQGGGVEALNQVRKKLINFTVGNEILQTRTNPDTQYKVYKKNKL